MSIRFRHLTSFLAATLALGLAGIASAQRPPTVEKTPGGPFVRPGATLPTIDAGHDIVWTVSFTNFTPMPAALNFWDEPQNVECEPGGAGNAQEDAPQPTMHFVDLNADGNCNEQVTVTGMATGFTINCNQTTQRLEVNGINLAVGAAVTITYNTRVDATATPGTRVCNWSHFTDPLGAPAFDTYPPGGAVPGCTCLLVAPPSGFDIQATKTAVADTADGRLIPGDPASTITYTITGTNTGTENIPMGSMTDTLGPGLEWDSIVDCPAPLTCTIDSATQLTVTGYNIPATDPDTSATVVARARVTCGAATDDDTGRVCNQGTFNLNGGTFPTDDPSLPGPSDPTCLNVVWSNLTTSSKFMESYDDTNPANGQLDANERVHFVIRAKNTGRYRAANVVVSDTPGSTGCFDPATIIAGDGGVVSAGTITWNVGDLSSLGGSRDVHFSVVLTANATCCNQGNLNSDERIGCGQRAILTNDPSTTAPGDTTCLSPGPQPDLDVTKDVVMVNDADGSGTFTTGDQIRWTVTVHNVGAGAATGAQLFDQLLLCQRDFDGNPTVTTDDPADPTTGTNNSTAYAPPIQAGIVQIDGFGGTNGIRPGETLTVSWLVRLQNDVCCNQATVTYAESAQPRLSDDPRTPGMVNDRTCLVPPTGASGTLQKTVNPVDQNTNGTFEVGERLDYTLTFTNTGSADMTNVQIIDASQACVQIDITSVVIVPSAGATDGSSGGNVQVTLATIAPAQSVTITFTAAAGAPGDCCNQATWSSDQVPGRNLSDRDPSDFTPDQPTCHFAAAIITGGDNLSLRKVVTETGCLDPGSVVHYTLIVDNVGTSPVSGSSIEDILDVRFTDIVADPPLSFDPVLNRVFIADAGTFGVGETKTFTYQATLPCRPSGTLDNTATLTFPMSGGGTTTRTDTKTVTWGLPDLTTSDKTYTWTDTDADGKVDPGETVHFTVVVRNAAVATCAARLVAVTDLVDTRFDYPSVNGSASGGTFDAATGILTWDSTGNPSLASIDPGASVTLTFDAVVAASASGQTVTNSVTIKPANKVGACPIPEPTADIALSSSPGSPAPIVIDGAPPAGVTLLRNDFVSCRATAFQTVRGAPPAVEPVLRQRPVPQVCSNPPAINPAHPQTDTLNLPLGTTTFTFAGDATAAGDTCPQIATGDGRVLIYYELADNCAPMLMVHKGTGAAAGSTVLNW